MTTMKTRHLLALLAMCCLAPALVGCASTDSQKSESYLNEKNLQRDEAVSSTGLSQPVILDGSALRKPELDTNAALTLDEWRHFDTNAVAKENFGTSEENDDAQINVTEFSTQAASHSKLYSIFGDAELSNNDHLSGDQQEFQPQGLRLFSIRF